MTSLATEPAAVLVDDDQLLVEHLRITDPDAVAFVSSSDDPELAFLRCVEMGARVLRLANATVDTQVVEHRFDEITKSLDRSVDALARRIDDSAHALLDDPRTSTARFTAGTARSSASSSSCGSVAGPAPSAHRGPLGERAADLPLPSRRSVISPVIASMPRRFAEITGVHDCALV